MIIFLSSISYVYAVGIDSANISGDTLKSGLVGHWTFDGRDVVGGTIRGVSGNGSHGGAVNIATSTFYTSGKLGQGYGLME